jgi:N-acetylglucosaminyl-diphospho-decaprenol L-rhamnosyltransferase
MGPNCTVRPVIVAVVVTHAPPAGILARCLDALGATEGLDRVVVVDTGQAAPGPSASVDVIRVDNRGYGAAANVGFDRAVELGAKVIVLLNDDVIVQPGWLSPLVAALDETGVGVAQPKLLFADRPEPTINSLGVEMESDGAGRDIAIGEPDREVGRRPIEYFTGGAIAVTSEFVAATGGFDERWFLYYEDIDLAERGRALGFEYRLVGDSVVEHVGSASTASTPDRTRLLQERNRLWCAFRHGSLRTVGGAMWLSVRRLRHHPRRVHARALVSGTVGGLRRLGERVAQRRRIRA